MVFAFVAGVVVGGVGVFAFVMNF